MSPVQAREPKSKMLDDEADKFSRQGRKRNLEFAARLREALGGREQAAIARNIGVGKSAIGEWLKGSMPAGDKLLSLADQLGVEPRWLASGEGLKNAAEDSDWVILPRYDLLSFNENGKPDSVEKVALRRDLLGRWGNVSKLWVAAMPSDAAPEIAREGDTLLCTDPEPQLVDGRAYVFQLDGRTIVRRVQFRPEGLVLKTDRTDPDPYLLKPEDLDRLQPIARILAAVVLKDV